MQHIDFAIAKISQCFCMYLQNRICSTAVHSSQTLVFYAQVIKTWCKINDSLHCWKICGHTVIESASESPGCVPVSLQFNMFSMNKQQRHRNTPSLRISLKLVDVTVTQNTYLHCTRTMFLLWRGNEEAFLNLWLH